MTGPSATAPHALSTPLATAVKPVVVSGGRVTENSLTFSPQHWWVLPITLVRVTGECPASQRGPRSEESREESSLHESIDRA